MRRGERRGRDGRISVDVVWRDLSPWAIEHGPLTIFPLSRADDSDDARERMTGLQRSLERAFVHFFGGDGIHAESPLDPDEGYGLMLSGLELASPLRYVWRVQDYAFTLVHAADPDAKSATTLSLHVYPAEWRWPDPSNANTKRAASRRRRIAKQIQEARVQWTWPGDAPEPRA